MRIILQDKALWIVGRYLLLHLALEGFEFQWTVYLMVELNSSLLQIELPKRLQCLVLLQQSPKLMLQSLLLQKMRWQ
jgi:hypothetical protein